MKNTTAQQNAIDYRGHAVIVAVPGAGKTRVLISKVSEMLKQGYRRILMVSFTNAAADEITQRLNNQVEKALMKHVLVSTIHSVLLDHIKRNIGSGLLPPQQDTSLQLSILKSMGMEPQSLDKFKKIIETNKVSSDEEYEEARQKYINKVLQTKKVSLGNVMAQGVQWMKEGKLPPLPFSFIAVDEFQDCCASQIELFLLHGLSNITINVVGDDDQSIFGFRSAQGVRAFLEVERVLGAKRFVLSENFRSHSEILSLSSWLIRQNIKRIPKEIKSMKGSGGVVSLKHYSDPFSEAEKVALEISSNPGLDTLVLARNGQYLEKIEQALYSREIPFVNVSSAKSFDSIPAQIALNGLMALATGDREKYNALLNILLETREEADIVKASLLYKGSTHGMTGTCKKVHDGLFNARKLFVTGRMSDGFVLYFDMLTNQLNELGYQQTKQLQAMQKYLSLCKGTSLKQRYNQLLSKKQEATQVPIKLMTMHSSKGLEAERVFVVGVAKKIIPSDKALGECMNNGALIQSVISEERRLLFVALTRAMSQLYISSVQGTISQPNRYGFSLLLNEVVIDELM